MFTKGHALTYILHLRQRVRFLSTTFGAMFVTVLQDSIQYLFIYDLFI